MKIAHVSDIHIRNLKYHKDYRLVFDNLYRALEIARPDLIVNTGDLAHTKTMISPEFVDMSSNLFKRLAEIAPVHSILGNHDLNLMNPDRQDALTPVVQALNDPRIFLHKKSGPVEIPELNAILWVFAMADQKNYPTPADWRKREDRINIGLFHGSIMNCVTDSNWRMTNTEHQIEIFDGLDYALLGDIHKQQFLDPDRRIGYAGSLIQQNFGEDPEKGFLLWDIQSKTKHTVSPVNLEGSRKFYTVKLGPEQEIPDLEIPVDSRIRVSPANPITLVQQKEIEQEIRRRFHPYDVITLAATSMGAQKARVGQRTVDFENLRNLPVQERLIRDYLKDKNVPLRILEMVIDLNRKHQVQIEQQDELSRNVTWRINKIAWSNLFNYGESNVVDFSSLGGLTGIFAPNGAGKSNFIDVINEICFDATTRGVNKNIFLINDNKDQASGIADISVGEQNYVIERSIDRIKYGQRKLDQTKEWGKTSVDFYGVDDVGGRETLNGTLRPETERSIRQKIGTFDDFMLTSLSAQWNPFDLIACKETKRKEILYRFLDLDIFEEKWKIASSESKDHTRQLNELEKSEEATDWEKLDFDVNEQRSFLASTELQIVELKKKLSVIDEKIVQAAASLVPTDQFGLERSPDVMLEELEERATEIRAKILVNEQAAVLQVKEISDTESVIKGFGFEFLNARISERNEVRHELDLNIKLLETKKRERSAHKKNLKLLQEVPCGDQFPQCKFLIGGFESKVQMPTLEEEIVFLEKKIESEREEIAGGQKYQDELDYSDQCFKSLTKLTAEYDKDKLRLETLKVTLSGIDADRARIVADIERWEKLKTDRKKNVAVDALIATLRSEKSMVVTEISLIQGKMSDINRTLGAIESALEAAQSDQRQLQDLRDTCMAYEHYSDAMGKDGIAYYILTQKLPLINEEINKILANAADFGVFIEHDPEEQSIRIYLQYGQYKSRLLELGGGAEKMLASVAIRTALLNISNLPKTNMFIIDEGFGKLDPKNLESIGKMFDYLRTVFDHVMVVSHVETLKDMVDNIVEITSDAEGYAHVDIS